MPVFQLLMVHIDNKLSFSRLWGNGRKAFMLLAEERYLTWANHTGQIHPSSSPECESDAESCCSPTVADCTNLGSAGECEGLPVGVELEGENSMCTVLFAIAACTRGTDFPQGQGPQAETPQPAGMGENRFVHGGAVEAAEACGGFAVGSDWDGPGTRPPEDSEAAECNAGQAVDRLLQHICWLYSGEEDSEPEGAGVEEVMSSLNSDWGGGASYCWA
jgi:hypothetical protein